MTVAVYADLRWQPGTGIGAVQSALLSRIPAGFEIVDLGVMGRIGSPLSPLAISGALSRQKPRRGAFWSPGYMPPLSSSLPSVVTVHDLTHLHFYTRLHAAYYNGLMKRLYRKCRGVICVSEYTRREFLEWAGMRSDDVHVIHNGVSELFFNVTEGFGLPFPYVFYPGNRRAYKNLDRLLEAYARSRLPVEGIHLVLTGPPDRHLQARAKRIRIERLTHFVGQVREEEVARLYRGATAVVFVSLYEGFGLPIVEAMAAGVPVLTSNVSSMPEIAGEAAVLVEPTRTDEIAAGLECVSFDSELRRKLVRLGKDRARLFDWDSSAARVWQAVARVAGQLC